MMTDLYQLTMMNGYLHHGMQNNRACFDLFYRKRGDIMAYAVAAGLEQAIEYVKNLKFTQEDIQYLTGLRVIYKIPVYYQYFDMDKKELSKEY